MKYILLAGASGRLGMEINATSQSKGFSVIPLLRTEINKITEKIQAIPKEPLNKFIIIDVTLPEGTENLINAIKSSSALNSIEALVIGSTGHSPEQLKKIQELSSHIPVILSSNFSRGVYLFEEILKARTSSGVDVATLARQLGFDLALWESHHTLKKDAPSGTARTLAGAASIPGDRISSTRVGSVVGEHTLFMSQESEELRMTHVAHARKLFAEGALDLCRRLFETPLKADLYNMAQALNQLIKAEKV